MCLARTHSLAGLTAGVATAGPVFHLHHPAQVVPYLAACAGAGVLPDLDHPSATLAHSFGFLTKLFAEVVGKVSGGHRHGTHSIAGIAAFTGLAWAAVHWRHDVAGRIGLAVLLSLLFAGALYALRLGGHWADLPAIAGAVIMTVTGAGLATVAAATGIGCAAHIFAGDLFTREGCPLAWPLWGYRMKYWPRPLAFTTGTGPEWAFAAVIVVILAALVLHQAAHVPLPHLVRGRLAL